MPSKNPRMVLTVKPATYAAVVKAAQAAAVFPSHLVATILDDMVPMFEGLALAAQATKEQRAEAFDHLADSLGVAQVQAAQLQLEMSRTRRSHIQSPPAAAKKSGKKRHA